MRTILKKSAITILSLTVLLSLVNCKALQNANNKQKGAIIGATSGAIIGAIIGNNAGKGGNGEIGAVIGGVVGGAAGVIIGHEMDKQAKRIQDALPGAKVERVDNGIVITLDEKSGIYFDTNKSNINTKSATTLDKLSKVFIDFSDTKILVVGHTDNVGSQSYNMNLSKTRAYAVSNYLINKGLKGDRISTNWFGETQPKYTNSTAEGRAKNRRVNIAIVPSEKMIKDAKLKADAQ
ncbi:MAG: OmpA family protein [Flavobacteriaceae bacterium]|nr:OmpA family protein [Flavobacteriaceae bacterium]